MTDKEKRPCEDRANYENIWRIKWKTIFLFV